MPDLELLRRLAPPADPPDHEQARQARQAILDHIERPARRRRRTRRWLLAAPALAAGAAALVIVLVGGGTGSRPSPAAAAALRHVAAVAREVTPSRPLGPGQFIYTKSVDAYMSVTVYKAGKSYRTIVPHRRETWLGRDGTGWLISRTGGARFLAPGDRRDWIVAGRPSLHEGDMNLALGNDDGPDAPMATLRLPSDPDALYARLEHDAGAKGNGLHTEMFVLIGDALRENYTSPAQRAALYEVAARLPGVELVGPVRDAVGRPGIAVAIADHVNKTRQMLIFDPRTSALLGEEERVLGGNWAHYPEGTRIGYAAYLRSEVVDHIKERPN